MNFYKTKAWRKTRKKILIRDNYECQMCKALGKYSRGNTVHHVKHLETHPELGLVWENLLTVCEACHNKCHPEKMKIERVEKEPITPERW